MKILMLNTSDTGGGVGSMLTDLEKGLKDKGHEVNYLVGYKTTSRNNVTGLYTSGMLLRYLRTYFLANDLDYGANKHILDHPLLHECDLVHIHNIHGGYININVLPKIARLKPVVWTLHDKWAITAHCAQCIDCKHDNNGKHFTPGRNRYTSDMLWNNSTYLWEKKRNIYNNTDNLFIVSPSSWLIKKIKTSILKDKQIHLIHNGIDTSVFAPKNNHAGKIRLGIPKNKFVIGYVGHWGSVDYKKGGEYFKEIASHYSRDGSIIFLCIGGNNEKSSRPLLNGNMYSTSYTQNRLEIARQYQACDALLYTSLAENFPITTLEALSTGLPIIAFDVGGVPEQIRHKINGYIARHRNFEDLVLGIKYITSLKKDEYIKMRNANRNKALRDFGLAKMADKYESLYKKVTKQ